MTSLGQQRYATQEDLDEVKKDNNKIAMAFNSHDTLCAERYGNILKSTAEIKADQKTMGVTLQELVAIKSKVSWMIGGMFLFIIINNGDMTQIVKLIKAVF